MTNPLYIPRGLMCHGCTKALEKCNHIPFDQMRVIVKHKDGYKEVKCTEYKSVKEEG